MKMNMEQLDDSQMEKIQNILSNIPDASHNGFNLLNQIEGDNTVVYKDGIPLGTRTDFINVKSTSPAAALPKISTPFGAFIQILLLLSSTVYLCFTMIA